MVPLLLSAPLWLGCDGQDIDDDVLPTSPTLPLVGSHPLQFRERVPKNLIFLSIDTMRKDHLGQHGDLGLTPFLDQIAREGVVLDDHLQCSNWTYGSTTCTLAGRTNIERGQLPRLNGNEETRTKVPEGTPFLSTWLGQQGYYSVLVSANDWLGLTWGNAQGYDEVLRPGGNALSAKDVGMEAISSAIDEGKADKWFMHLHFMEPHAAYDPPASNIIGEDALEPWPDDLTDRPTHYAKRDEWPQMSEEDQDLLERHLRLLYEGEIRTMDERIEDIWNDLEREGYLNDTLVVIWNDHGEQFWEHGNQTHAYSMYGEENDGFALFWSRNIQPARWEQPTSTTDLVPTILDILSIDMPDEVTGYPVGTAPASRPIYGEALARIGGINVVTLDDWKMHFRWYGAVEVYDRGSDPGETINLYDPEDPKTLELWDLIRPQAEQMATQVVGGSPSPTFPAELP